MTKEDKKIYYRPELAKILKNIEDLAIKVYSDNFEQIFFQALARSYKYENPELSKRLEEVANALTTPDAYNEIVKYLQDIIADGFQINPQYLFPGNRIKIIIEASKEQMDEIIQFLLDAYGKSLTKQEIYMIKDFINKINAPYRDPNFDNGRYNADISEFYEYIERHKEYLKRELAPTIEMFNTPDKEDGKTALLPEKTLDVTDNLKIQESKIQEEINAFER